jgi:GH24 family phage-related lysozyme (muramidase)
MWLFKRLMSLARQYIDKLDAGYQPLLGNSPGTVRQAVLARANTFIRQEENCFLHAYPDPASALGRKLGNRGIWAVGRTGILPAEFSALRGDPWTIGWGQTGVRVKPGTHWTQAQADTVLATAIESLYQQINEVWPGAHLLKVGAQVALISLLYNRGASLVRREDDILDRRWEMRELVIAVVNQDYISMARLFRSMKRLWVNRGLDGLVTRREKEAKLIEQTA